MWRKLCRIFSRKKIRKNGTILFGKLGKKDSAVLKQLLLFKSDEDSESDGRKYPKREREEESESDSVRAKVPQRSEHEPTKPQKIEDSDSDSQKLKLCRKTERKKEETPMKMPSKNIKVEIIDSDSGEKKPRKQEADDTPVKKIDDVKPKIKKEKNGTRVQVKKETKKETKEVDKEYFVFINGEKWLVQLVTEEDKREPIANDSDSSIKETKQPKTLKPFYTVSDLDENEEKHKNLNQLDGNGDCIVVSAGSRVFCWRMWWTDKSCPTIVTMFLCYIFRYDRQQQLEQI